MPLWPLPGGSVDDPSSDENFRSLAQRGGDLEATGTTPIGPAGGKLSGEYPNPEFAALEAWNAVSFENSWENFEAAGTYDTCNYRKGLDGRVYLKGLCKHGINPNEKTIFTLPSGFRPAKQKLFACETSLGVAVGSHLDVLTNGEVIPLGLGAGEIVWLTLEQISFYTD